ncbi:sulfotransferase family 2 domain-containing protein [Novosphingobium sp. AP12]|uniref:sulfotransferase family 2 domain-containing protein n=1 Tax=Novosphingobium sp. AP12 TaxID=1144305 RepID=UPI00027205FC|nr:sulfotransferase family 2 domain-containing protein [Novosphingobium sp. AP12]EJL22656.1 Sulfotransferase family [Novosphingobium sp. AP12]
MHQPLSPARRPGPPGTTGIKRLIASAFGVRLLSDVPERVSRWHIPYPPNTRRRDRIAAIRQNGVLFIHVPKNAGTSVCDRLYGEQIKHETVRYYAMVAPDVLDLPSFAIVRDPVARFLSAYRYARSDGTRDRAVARPFNARYRAFACVDDAIDHLATARSLFDIDHIFRPQSWYLTDARGECRIDTLVPYEALGLLGDITGLSELGALPRLNRCGGAMPPALDPSQEAFVRDFYGSDFALRRRAAVLTSRTFHPCSARRATS